MSIGAEAALDRIADSLTWTNLWLFLILAFKRMSK
jgi:hypothetical protein